MIYNLPIHVNHIQTCLELVPPPPPPNGNSFIKTYELFKINQIKQPKNTFYMDERTYKWSDYDYMVIIIWK